MRRAALVLVAGLATAGCFRATVVSGLPPDRAAERYDPKWHHAYLGAIVEGSGPHALAEACPEGWAEIEVETNAFQGLLQIATWTLYAPEDVTVVCATPGAPERAAPEGFAPPPPPASSAYPASRSDGFPPAAPSPDL